MFILLISKHFCHFFILLSVFNFLLWANVSCSNSTQMNDQRWNLFCLLSTETLSKNHLTVTLHFCRKCNFSSFKQFSFHEAIIVQRTCLIDLISDGETCSVGLIIRHELDEQLITRGDNRRGGDFPTVLPHQLTILIHAVSHLHVVVPGVITAEAALGHRAKLGNYTVHIQIHTVHAQRITNTQRVM